MNIRHSAILWALMCTPTLLLATVAYGQTPAPASSTPMLDASDSAANAREFYQRARQAMARKDTAEALRELSAAAHVWAVQPAYANALLDLAIRARSESRAIEAMHIANGMGYALPSPTSAITRRNFQSAEFRAALAQQGAFRAPFNRATLYRTLDDSTLFPEGIATDARSGMLYVSSVRHRNVLAIDKGGSERWLIHDGRRELGALFGVAVDTTRSLLWVASAYNSAMRADGVGANPGARDAGSAASAQTELFGDSTKLAALFAVSLGDGTIVKRIHVPAAVADASPGDIALMDNGDVLMSDSQAGILWWLKSASDTLIGIRHRLLRSPQGIVPHADNRSAIVADYSHGLLRVDLETQSAIRVRDAAGHSTIGIDGLVRAGNNIIAVQNGITPAQVLRLELNADGTRVLKQRTIDRNISAPSPTGGVMINGAFVYIANSLWEMLDANGRIDAKAKLPKPLLLSLPIGVRVRESGTESRR